MSHLPPLLQPSSAILLIVDLQEKLLPSIHEGQACLATNRKLIAAARVLEVPLLLTEQYPAGLGPTCAPIREAVGDLAATEKTRFSGCVQPVIDELARHQRQQVIVAGIECHVCVLLTVLDLLRLGYTPYVCADAVGSRRQFDWLIALDRMRQAGAVVTTAESVIFEMLNEAGTEPFKQILKVIK